MNVIPFRPKEKEKNNKRMQANTELYEQLLEIEERIDRMEIRIARKEKWIRSGLLQNKKELYMRYVTEAEQLKKERAWAERERKVIMELMKKDQA